LAVTTDTLVGVLTPATAALAPPEGAGAGAAAVVLEEGLPPQAARAQTAAASAAQRTARSIEKLLQGGE
jgi:hypothetical protein